MKNIYLYTPWCEQGLSYDAKVIEEICSNNNIRPFITYRTKRKIQWACDFIPLRKIHTLINKDDIFFCFERFPNKYLSRILEKTEHSYLMLNYEYYTSDDNDYHMLFNKIFCKSKIAFEGCKEDGLNNLKYLPWILWNFPIAQPSPLGENIKVIFNGGTGGFQDRRNFASIIDLLKNYSDDDVEFILKFTSDIRRWTKKIINKNLDFIKCDKRTQLICSDLNRSQYQSFLIGNDINLAPSKFEGFGLTLLEALHSRIPTITSDCSPMNEIIHHDVNGLCIAAREVGKIRKQPICEINREKFIQEFSRLVKDRDKLYKMKKNTNLFIQKNRKNLIDYFTKLFKT